MVSTLEATNLDSPITPANGKLLHKPDVEAISIYTTPDDNLLENEQLIQNKDSVGKKKGPRAGSKRKLFIQSGTPAKVKKMPSPSLKSIKKTAPSPVAASPVSKDGPWPSFPLTERQQLQYLLEVTAKDAQQKEPQETDSDENQGTMFTKLKKKDVNKKEGNVARINKRNERGETLLHLAAIKGDTDDTIELIKAGITVNAKDYAGWTPLHEACNFGHLEIVEQLVMGGANVNSPGYEDISPLHDAVINNHVQVVEVLLKYGADPEQRTMQGFTAFDLARSTTILELLQSAKMKTISAISSKETDNSEVGNDANSLENGINGYSSHTSSDDGCYQPVQTRIEPVYPDTVKPSSAKETYRQNNLYSRRSSSSSSSLHNSDIDDSIDPARLNECLDKAMLQMSSYLDPKKECYHFDNGYKNSDYNMAPLPSLPMTRSKSDDERSKKSPPCSNGNVAAHAVSVDVSRPQPKNDKLIDDNTVKVDVTSNKENQSIVKNTQCQDKTSCGNIPKVDSNRFVSDSNEKSSQECVGHIRNPTWRKALAKQYYNPANLPLYIPGYPMFTMKSKSYTTQTQDEISKSIDKQDGSIDNCDLSRLKTQQKTEQEKLKLCLEQEILRLFGNFARTVVKKDIPIGACTIIQHQMLSHGRKVHEQETSVSTKELNGQSMKAELEELIQKFEKRKVELLNRQRHECDAVIALQKLGLDEGSQGQSVINEAEWKIEDFDIAPAGFKAYYEQFFTIID